MHTEHASTQPLAARICLAWGALNGALAVAMAAASTHAPALLAASYLPSAVQMHLLHALGLVLLGVLLERQPRNRWWRASAVLLSAGVLLFCLNLYARALWDFVALRGLVPAGGSAFILGWLLLGLGAWRQPRPPAA